MNMKRNSLLMIGAAIMLVTSLNSCSNESGRSSFHMRNFANTGCKSVFMTRGEGEVVIDRNETIEVKALSNGYLSFNHENAIFPCGNIVLKIEATIDGHEIILSEKAEGEFANCVCPYDLYCEVGPLEEGIEYTIIVFHNKAEYRRFFVRYQKGMEGSFVVEDGWEHRF